MKTMTATQARTSFSALLSTAENEPVTIERSNSSATVLMSAQRYQELQRIEDILYAEAAKTAIKEGLLSETESEDLLTSL